MATQSKSVSTSQWFKNAGKSMGSISSQILKKVMPVTHTTGSEMREAIREARNFTTQFTNLSRTQDIQLQRSRVAKTAKNILHEAMGDLRSGNFGIKKIADDMTDSYNDEEEPLFNIGFSDGGEPEERSPEEIILGGQQAVGRAVMRSGAAQLDAMQEMTNVLVGTNQKISAANTSQIINATVYVGNMLNANLIGVNSRLDMINENLVKMIQFQNENVSVTNQAILDYIEESSIMFRDLGKMMENFQKSRNGSSRDRRNSFKEGFNFFDYKEMIKKNFSNSTPGSLVSMLPLLMQSGDHKLGVGDIIASALTFAMPKDFKKTLGRADKNMGRYIQEMIYRIGDLSTNKNPLLSLLGEVFGQQRGKFRGPYMGNYMKDAMPWNGIAQKALVEVIPEYLASIEAHITKMDKRYMNYEEGVFQTKKEIRQELDNSLSSRFSMEAYEAGKKLTQYLERQQVSADEQKRILSQLNTILNQRVAGDITVGESRSKMGHTLGMLNDKEFSRIMMGLEDAIESITDALNDKYAEIESKQSVYRNLYNQGKGRYAYKPPAMNAFSLIFPSEGIDAKQYIKDTLRRYGRDVSQEILRDEELLMRVTMQLQANADPELIAQTILSADNSAQFKGTAKQFLNRFRRNNAMKGPGKVSSIINDLDAMLFNRVYGINRNRESRTQSSSDIDYGNSDDDGGPRQRITVRRRSPGAASSNATHRQGQRNVGSRNERTSSRRNVRLSPIGVTDDQIKNLSSRIIEGSLDDTLGLTEKEMADNTAIINSALEDLNDQGLDPTLEGSIAQMANTTQVGMLSILNSFQNLTGGIFGANGIFKKFFESSTFKKMMNGVKDKLVGKDGLFHDEWQAIKAGGKKLWTKTKGHLVNAYDFVYTNTMKYTLGEDYENSEAYQKYLRHLDLKKNLSERELRKQATVLAKRRAKAEGRSEPTKEDIDQELARLKQRRANNIIPFPNQKSTSSNTSNAQTKNNVIEFKMPDTVNSDGSIKKNNGTIKVDANDSAKLQQISAQNVVNASMQSAQRIRDGGEKLSETMFGDPKESDQKKKSSFLTSFKKVLPKALAAGIVGAGAVALSGGSMGLLGSLFLPSSIIGGAIVGAGGMILSQTEAFKSLMFGKKNDDGERQGGLINKKLADAFKKALPAMVGGATLGALKHLITGRNGIMSIGPMGVVTNALLPGGVLGGALIGLGFGLLKHNETIKNKLFGAKDDGGKRSGGILSGGYNKITGSLKNAWPKIKGGVKGLGIGALSGTVLSNMGFIPAMFSVGGPIGAGIIGMSLGFASGSKKFNEFLFGSELLDKDGNPTGKRAGDGLLTRTRNLIMNKIFEPIGDAFSKSVKKMGWWTKEALEFPFRKAFGPILDGLSGVKDNIVDVVSNVFEKMGNGILDVFKTTMKTLFSPFAKILRFVGKGTANLLESSFKLATAPVSIGLKGLSLLTMGKRRKGYMEFYGNYAKQFMPMLRTKWSSEVDKNGRYTGGPFGKVKDIIGAITNPDDLLRKNARAGWNEEMRMEGKDGLYWREVPEEQRALKRQKQQQRDEWKRWAKIDKLRQGYIDEWGGREMELRPAMIEELQRKFGRFGIGKEYLQTSDDIMDLIYRKRDFKNRMSGKKGTDGITLESEEQRKSRENTEALDEERNEILEDIRDMFKEAAFRKNHPDYDTYTDRQQRQIARNLKRRAKKYGVEFGVPSVSERDAIRARDLSDEGWNAYRNSTEYITGDFSGWLNRNQGNFGIPGNGKTTISGGHSPDTAQSQIAKALNDISANTANTAENTIMANQIATGGNITRIDFNKKRGKDFTAGEIGQYSTTDEEAVSNVKRGFGSVLSSLFKRKKAEDKKEARDLREEQEQANATALGSKKGLKVIDQDGNVSYIGDNSSDSTSTPSILGRILGGIGGGVKAVKNTKVGGFVTTLLKFWGIGSVAMGFVNALFPNLRLNDTLKGVSQRLPSDIENITDTFVVPFVSNMFTIVGDGLKSGVDFVVNNGETIYENIFKPVLTGVSNFIVEYGPSIITNGANVLVSLLPSIVDAAITVIPALAKAIGVGTWNATFGRWFGGSKTREVTAEEAANLEEMGINVYTDPNTGKMYELGSRTYIDSQGNQKTVMNAGALGAVGTFGRNSITNILRHGAKSAGGTAVRTAAKGVGGLFGGVTGAALHLIPGVNPVTGSLVGAKIGGAMGKGVSSIVGGIHKGINPESVIGRFLGVATQQAANEAAEKASNEAAEAVGKSIIDTFAEEASEKVVTTSTGTKLIVLGGNEAVETATKTAAKEAAEAAIKVGGKEAAETAQKSLWKGLLTKMKSAIKTVIDSPVLKSFAEGAGKKLANVSSLPKFIHEILLKALNAMDGVLSKAGATKIGKFISKIMTKLGLGTVKTIPIVGIVFAGIDGVTGAFEAANLFGVDNDAVDWQMRLISSLMKILLGLSIAGPVVDIILEVGSAILGVDLKQKIATAIYSWIAGKQASAELKASQEQMEIETQIYNEINNTNLSVSAYNDIKNKTVGDHIAGGFRSLFDSDYRAEQEAQKRAIAEAEGKVEQLEASGQLGRTNVVVVDKPAGYGRGALGYGNLSQNDPRWKNTRIGTLPNGKPSTMGAGGCGPTALAIAANDLGKSANPGMIGRFASRNGYISSGGANAGLFTEGAARLGMSGRPILSSGDMLNSLRSGNPVIMAGKGAGAGSPYTNAGHIVVARGMDSHGNVTVQDPMDGRTKRYPVTSLTKRTNRAFVYGRGRAMGYGPMINGLLGYGALDSIPHNTETQVYDNLSSYLTKDGVELMTTGDTMTYANIVGAGGNSFNYLQSAFKFFDIPQILQFTKILLSNQIPIRSGSGTTFEDKVANATGVTSGMLVKKLEQIATSGKLNYTKGVKASGYGQTFWTTYGASQNADDKQRYEASYLASFLKSFKYGTAKTSDKDDSNLAYDMYLDEYNKDAEIDFASMGKYGYLPTDPEFAYRMAMGLIKFSKNTGSDMGTITANAEYNLRIADLYNQLITAAKNNPVKRDRFNATAKLLNNTFNNLITTSDEAAKTAADKKKTLANNIASTYENALYRLNNDSVANYDTINLNGYTVYDENDDQWSELPYGKSNTPLREVPAAQRSYLMMLSSMLTTMTGKPFTPGFIISYLLPYLKARHYGGKKSPFNAWGEQNPGYIDRLAAENHKDDWEEVLKDAPELFASIDGQQITMKSARFNANNISDLRNYLANGIPFLAPFNRFSGSIFGGSNPESAYGKEQTAGILQFYNPDNDMIQQISADYKNPLYSLGKTLFETYPTKIAPHRGLLVQYKNGGGPKFQSTSGQMGIMAGDLEAPASEASSGGPFEILKNLLSGIGTVASGMLTSVIDTVSGSQVIKQGVGTIKTTMSSVKNKADEALGGGTLGFGEGATGTGNEDGEATTGTSAIMNDMTSKFSAISAAMQNALGRYMYGDGWQDISIDGISSGGMNVLPDYQTLSPTDSMKQIAKFLNGKGFNRTAMSGIMGAWQAESSNRADRVEGDYLKQFPGYKKVFSSNAAMNSWAQKLFNIYDNDGISINRDAYRGSDGNYYPGVGLAQWTGPRGYKLLQYLTKNGYGWGDLTGQLNYVMSEMSPSLKSKLNAAKTSRDAARIFVDGFEMYDGWSAKNPNDFNKRAGYANSAYTTLKNLGYGDPTLSVDTMATKFNEISNVMTAMMYAKNNGIPYSQAKEMVLAGIVPGAISTGTADWSGTGSSILNYVQNSLKGASITSPYGNRIHPIEGTTKFHHGTDFGAAAGTPVYSTTDGTVYTTGYHNARGYYVVIADNVGYHHYYQHLQAGSIAVSKGQSVVQGTMLGKVGSTGASTGPHLHYEIQMGGKSIDPKKYPWNNGAEGYGRALGYGNLTNLDSAFDNLVVRADDISAKIQSPLVRDMRQSTTRKIETSAADIYYGSGGSTGTRNLEIALKTGGLEDKLDAILDVMIDWKKDSLGKPGVVNNVTAVSNNGKTITKTNTITKQPTKPSNSRLREIHRQVASLS